MSLCQFCSNDSAAGVAQCDCGYGLTLGCTVMFACGACRAAHVRLGKFFRSLTTSPVPSRANSIRTKLLAVLRDSVASADFRYREDVCEILRTLDPFSQGFAGEILRLRTRLPLNAEFANEVRHQARRHQAVASAERAARDLELVRAGEAVAEFIAQIAQNQKFEGRIRETVRNASRGIRQEIRQVVSR
jgi:hypothetical protein